MQRNLTGFCPVACSTLFHTHSCLHLCLPYGRRAVTSSQMSANMHFHSMREDLFPKFSRTQGSTTLAIIFSQTLLGKKPQKQNQVSVKLRLEFRLTP